MFILHANTCTLHPRSFLAPILLPTAQICVVSLYNSHYGRVRFRAEASEWLSCLSGSIPNLFYRSTPRAVLFQTEILACVPLIVPSTGLKPEIHLKLYLYRSQKNKQMLFQLNLIICITL